MAFKVRWHLLLMEALQMAPRRGFSGCGWRCGFSGCARRKCGCGGGTEAAADDAAAVRGGQKKVEELAAPGIGQEKKPA